MVGQWQRSRAEKTQYLCLIQSSKEVVSSHTEMNYTQPNLYIAKLSHPCHCETESFLFKQ